MRNKNVESLRATAILLLLFYHFTVSLTVFKSIQMIVINEVICQFTMIAFFMISGYGTFMHFQRRECNGETIHFFDYIKSRFIKIAPAYYVCMFFLLLLTPISGFISREGLKSIFVYCVMLQNLFPSMGGDINGVTWTIALFMQFYLISYPIYKIVRALGLKSYPLFLAFSLLANKVLCGINAASGGPDVYYVIASIRQIFTTIDIFVLGMICGSLVEKRYFSKLKKELAVICAIIVFIITLLLVVKSSFIVGGLWGDGFKYYLWKPFISVGVGLILLLIIPCTFNYHGWLGRVFQFIAKNEYNTYLWHMVLFGNLRSSSALFNELADKTAFGTSMGMIVLSIVVGALCTKLTSNLSLVKH